MTLGNHKYRGPIPEARTKYEAEQAEIKIKRDVFEGKYGKQFGTMLFTLRLMAIKKNPLTAGTTAVVAPVTAAPSSKSSKAPPGTVIPQVSQGGGRVDCGTVVGVTTERRRT